MSKRYVVLGLSVVLALALAVPAFGGPSNPISNISASAKKIAQKALKKANTAQKTANTANSTANTALTEAKKAQTEAKTAQSSATGAKATADAAKVAAEKAEANANTRIKETHFNFGTSSGEDTEKSKSATASCESDEEVLGGGFAIGGESNKVVVTQSAPIFLYGHGWFAAAEAFSGLTPTWSIQANVMCGTK